jgi:hypothetical protein
MTGTAFAFDESKVKRDREGKFASIAERVNAVIASFKPQRIGSNKEASAYLKANKPKLTKTQEGAVDRYTGDGFLDLNKKMRAGDTSDPEVKRLDAAMRPLPDDLVVTRRVDLAALGVENGAQLEALRGQRYSDPAYMSTSLGSPYGGELGGVTLKIAAPKGTPAVLAAELSRTPSEREVLLGRGLQLVITSVKANDKYGYDVSAVIVPKED